MLLKKEQRLILESKTQLCSLRGDTNYHTEGNSPAIRRNKGKVFGVVKAHEKNVVSV